MGFVSNSKGHMNINPSISIIIPLAAHEVAWKTLLQDLNDASFKGEVVLVAQEELSKADQDYLKSFSEFKPAWVLSTPGRANQMNKGAESAKGEYLWFLHADTRLTHDAMAFLMKAMSKHGRALHYFNLKFNSDGPWIMWINAFGVWIRSHLFRLPFGDQGFLLKLSLFVELGGYNVLATYGEDHLLIWKAYQTDIPVVCVGGALITSARKYRVNGWLRTTLKHLYFTYKQALPQLVIMMRQGRSIR